MALSHLAITALDPPLGSGTSKAIRKIGRFGWLSWSSGWEADSHFATRRRRPWPRCNSPLHRPCAPGQPRRRHRLPGRRERPRAAPPQPLTGSPCTPPPAQHRELVAQHEDLQVPGGVAAGDRASSWMKRHRQVGESRQHQVASVVGGSVTVPNRVSMRTRSSQATSDSPHPTGSSAGCPDVTAVAPAGGWARHQT